MLYPFRHDFYHKMGYGYGIRSYHYEVRTASLPDSVLRKNVDYLTRDDLPLVFEYYNRVAASTHGMTLKKASEIEAYFRSGNTVVGYKEDGKLLGTMVFSFKKGPRDNVLCNHLVIHEWDYERNSLAGFLGFLRAQADQIERVVIDTQDDTLFYLMNDPYNEAHRFLSPVYQESSAHGLGLMYRVLDIEKTFEALTHRDFGPLAASIRFVIEDSFMPENARSISVVFKDGKPRVAAATPADATVTIGIGDFSSWIMGAVTLSKLCQYGLAQVSDENLIHAVDRAFSVVDKPRCTAHF
jgi:predicted acetyltransferase